MGSKAQAGRVVAGALGMLALVAVSRFVTGDLTVLSGVSQRSCGNGFCAERVERPELLVVPGYREVHVRHDGPAGRFYVQRDPFDDLSEVTITWNPDGGVSLSDETATLTWTGATLRRLGD
jgi:hypothetical protein